MFVSNDSDFEIRATMMLNNIDHTYEGIYRCSLENLVGKTDIIFELTVLNGKLIRSIIFKLDFNN